MCPDAHVVLACAHEADEALTGRIGVMGTPPEHWYYAGRDHLFFTIEGDIHHATCLRSHSLRSRPGYASESLASANSSLPASNSCRKASFSPHATSNDERADLAARSVCESGLATFAEPS